MPTLIRLYKRVSVLFAAPSFSSSLLIQPYPQWFSFACTTASTFTHFLFPFPGSLSWVLFPHRQKLQLATFLKYQLSWLLAILLLPSSLPGTNPSPETPAFSSNFCFLPLSPSSSSFPPVLFFFPFAIYFPVTGTSFPAFFFFFLPISLTSRPSPLSHPVIPSSPFSNTQKNWPSYFSFRFMKRTRPSLLSVLEKQFFFFLCGQKPTTSGN